jgi:hypothetical protein
VEINEEAENGEPRRSKDGKQRRGKERDPDEADRVRDGIDW